MKTQKTLIVATLVALTALTSSCKKEEPQPQEPIVTPDPIVPNPGSVADNTFKIVKSDNSGTQTVSLTSAPTVGAETGSQGSFYSYRGYFNVGANSTYDRVAVGFKSEPAVGTYKVASVNYYSSLSADQSGVNITYDGYNYRAIADSGKVTISLVNGKKKAIFENIVLDAGYQVPGTSGTQLPPNSKLTGVMVGN